MNMVSKGPLSSLHMNMVAKITFFVVCYKAGKINNLFVSFNQVIQEKLYSVSFDVGKYLIKSIGQMLKEKVSQPNHNC